MAKRQITVSQAEEIKKCIDDVVYFVSTYCYLRHTTQGKIKWNPYPYQLELLEALQRVEDVFVLKSRRVGASWTVCAYVLWLTMFHPDLTALLLSRKEFYAKGLLRRIKFMIKNLPLWMRPKLKTDSQSEMIFEFVFEDETAESNIISLTTTDESGRGEDAAIVFMDEGAFIPNADDTWAAVGPTASFGGQRVVVSTPNGVGGFFHRVIIQLQSGMDAGFTYIEAHWKRGCGLTDAWFKKASAGFSTQKILQEFELTFLSAGSPFFDLVKVMECYKPLKEFPEMAEFMRKTEWHASGVDTSEGHSTVEGEPDYHSVCILNEFGVQLVGFNSNKMPRTQFTGHIKQLEDGTRVKVMGVPTKLHKEYPGGMAIEIWGSGDITAQMHEIPEDEISEMVEFRTTNPSKMRILNSLRRAINALQIIITDPFTYHCMTTFEDQTSGVVQKAGASKGGFDDPVITLALSWMMLKRHGGQFLNLSGLEVIGERRVISIDGLSDAAMSELNNILPVGEISMGPMVQGLAREEFGRGLDDFAAVRSGRKSLRSSRL